MTQNIHIGKSMSEKKHDSIAQKAIKLNHEAWDHWAKLHPETEMYDMKRFRETKNSLTDVVLELLGDVRGSTKTS